MAPVRALSGPIAAILAALKRLTGLSYGSRPLFRSTVYLAKRNLAPEGDHVRRPSHTGRLEDAFEGPSGHSQRIFTGPLAILHEVVRAVSELSIAFDTTACRHLNRTKDEIEIDSDPPAVPNIHH